MAFNPAALPADVYAAYKLGPLNWPVVVKTAVQKQITDLDKLASIVFYLHHPERNGQQIAAHETQMINQWKGFRTMIKPLVPVMSKPDEPKKPSPPSEVSDWVLTDVEEWSLREYGKDVLEWAKIPPSEEVEAKEFPAPSNLRANYKVVFVWKSNNPKMKCVADSRPTRIKLLALLRDDLPYWMRAMRDQRIPALMRREAAEVAIRDYRDLIINRHMCPKVAFNYLKKHSDDTIREIILGLLQFGAKIGMPGTGPISNGLPDCIDFIRKVVNEDL